jgi:ATP-dependent helicase/nuclease subunit B
MRLPTEIESAFENGATVLTANVRAARWLRREYALRQREAGRRVWATPPIEDWDSWVLRLWQAHSMSRADAPLLLTSLQERSVWTRMQRDDAKLLVSPEGMAALAEEAYKLLCDYEAHEERNHAWGKTDAERFRQWAALFDRECAKQGWVSRAKLDLLVREALTTGASGDLPLPAKVVLLGFDRIAPARRRLIAAMEARGVEVVLCAGGDAEESPRLVRATDRRDEITTCAHWIRALLDENPLFEKRAETRIGVIVPDMGAVRSDVERIFRRVLMPETDDVFAQAARMPFEFSLGRPLGDVPVIRAALLLLRWAAGPLSEEEMSWLLLSGYLENRDQGSGIRDQGDPPPTQADTGLELCNEGDGTADPSTAVANHPLAPTTGPPGTPAAQPSLRMTSMEEYLALGSFDAALRNSGSLSLEISLRNMLREMRRFPALAGVHTQLENLQKMAAVNHVSEEVRTPGRWVDLAQFLLDQAGWRGAQRRDEIDFQARARWERLLDEVALLDFDGRRAGYREFVGILEMQAGEAIFAAESHGAPVQVMGALEASGQQFDAVWFLGADDHAWPARGRLHPLLPNDVQRRAGMPHATAEDDWELAATATERIVASVDPNPGLKIETWGTRASEPKSQGTEPREQGSGNRGQGSGISCAVFSHAERDKDGELRASPLIALVAPGAEWQRSRELLHELGVETEVHAAAKLHEIADASGAIAWPREECAGGYSVIRDQAACPFRAFAARRLNAEELNRNDWGLSAAERGLLLHRVMELLWSPEKGRMHTLGDLQAAIAEGRLGEVIEGTIADVFAQLMKEHGSDTWMAAYLKSEQRRLRVRLEEWLAIEAKRVPFTVEATEKVLDNVSVGGLKLRLRADRVDRVGDGKRLLLDYKSGEVATKDWEGMRPNEPQLPLYAVFGNVEDVAGVLFARINVEKTGLEGCVSDAAILKGPGMKAKLTKQPFDNETKKDWANALVNLAEDFLHGEAQVDPKDGRKTCRFCAMPGVCRVAELRETVGEEETDSGEGDE